MNQALYENINNKIKIKKKKKKRVNIFKMLKPVYNSMLAENIF
jgi:hypothetical protein